MTFTAGQRVRLPDGRSGTVTYVFEQHPFAGDVSVAVDGRRERELWAAEDLIRITEPAREAGHGREERGVSLPISEAIMDAVTEARVMNRDEGKTSNVVLLHPSLAARWYAEIKVERPVARDGFEPAPMIGRLALVEDDSVDEDEVCVLSDEDWLEHERLKKEAGK